MKCTEFVVDFLIKDTNVRTLKGLENLKSLARSDSIELVTAKMSSISASKELFYPTEFSEELIRDFEFTGDVISEEDAIGKMIQVY